MLFIPQYLTQCLEYVVGAQEIQQTTVVFHDLTSSSSYSSGDYQYLYLAI